MRLWTLHPKYLDPQGLVALWREALLAQPAQHLRAKLAVRNPRLVDRVRVRRVEAHPLFRIVSGPRASWEK